MRAAYAAQCLRELGGVAGLTLPHVHAWATPVWHVFAVRVGATLRARFIEHLTRNGIGTNIHYPRPIHLQECFVLRG